MHVLVGCQQHPPNSVICQYNSNVLTIRGCNVSYCRFSRRCVRYVRVTSLSSTCSPVAHEDKGLHDDYVVNSDVMLSLMLSNLYGSIWNFWIMRCNKDLCFLVLHLKLCVLAIDLGTSTIKHGIDTFKMWGHYRIGSRGGDASTTTQTTFFWTFPMYDLQGYVDLISPTHCFASRRSDLGCSCSSS
jgi:hypothetical protein